MYSYVYRNRIVLLFLILLLLSFFNDISLVKDHSVVFAGSIGGEPGGPGGPCGEPEFPPCGGPFSEPTPPGGIPTPTFGGPTETPTPTPFLPGGGTATPTPTDFITSTPTPTPGGPTSTPTPTPTGPTITPTPTGPTPTPTLKPTSTPYLSPCPDAANNCIPTKAPSPTPINSCGQSCIVGNDNQCPINQQCLCPEGAVCPTGVVGVGGYCGNPYCSGQTEQQSCQCTNCKCDALVCENTSTNPGKVITIPRITPVNEIGLSCSATCEEYIVDGEIRDCNEVLTPQPVQFDKANGETCKDYTIQVKSNGETCGCTNQVCCPTCQEPVVVPGYEAGCEVCGFNTSVGGEEMMCPGNSTSCPGSEIAFNLENPSGNQYCIDLPDGTHSCGTSGNPPTGNLGNAGFYQVTLSCQPPGGGPAQVCKKEIVVGCECENTGPTPTLGPWFKLKNASFSRQTDLLNLIPDPATSFDNGVEDLVCHDTNLPSYRCMLSREAGAGISTGSINLNNAPISHRGWKQDNANVSLDLSPTEYLEYVKSKKKYKIITKNDLTNFSPDETLTSDVVYILDNPGSSPIKLDDRSFEDQTLPFVLIFDGDVRIDDNITPLESVSASIIVTGSLGISTRVDKLHGIYYTNTLDFTYDNPNYPNPLMIKGNIIAYEATNTMIKRVNSPISKPGIFVDFDTKPYTDLWPLLTTKEATTQEEIQ